MEKNDSDRIYFNKIVTIFTTTKQITLKQIVELYRGTNEMVSTKTKTKNDKKNSTITNNNNQHGCSSGYFIINKETAREIKRKNYILIVHKPDPEFYKKVFI